MKNCARLLMLGSIGAVMAAAQAIPTVLPQLSLPGDLQGLLVTEMQAVQAGMTRVLPALVSGDWRTVASEADSIRGSYILEQRLTPAQREELERILPEGFKQRDEAFHALAAELAAAARRQDAPAAAVAYGRLAQACVDCHSHYAAARFPGLVAPTQ